MQSWAFEFAVLQCSLKSYLQANLTIKVAYFLGQAYKTPGQDYLIENTKNAFFII